MRNLITTLALLFAVSTVSAEEIGSVSTVFKLLGPNDKIIIEAFDDPKVEGVTCHLSRGKGVSGAAGLQRTPPMRPSPVARSGPLPQRRARRRRTRLQQAHVGSL